MFGGWAGALVLLVSLMGSSLSKYISGQLAESNGDVAVVYCAFTASVQDVELVNDDSGVNIPSACTIAYTVRNYSDDGSVCEVAVRPHFRIYAAAEFLNNMVFQMAEITADATEVETTEAITPPYYMPKLLTAGTFSTDSYLSSADTESTNVENALNALKELNYVDNTAAETVTVTENGDNFYAECKNTDGQTAAITVVQTTQEQSYTPFFTRGEALSTPTVEDESGTGSDTSSATASTANDMSASPLYAEMSADGEYMCLDIELYGVSLPAGEKTEKTYVCSFAPAANIDNSAILGKTYEQLEESIVGWYYDVKIQPETATSTTSDDGTVTVRVRNEISETAATVAYYVLSDSGKETELTVSEDGTAYSGGGYTFSADVLKNYADYTYNPKSGSKDYILGQSFGIVYPLQVKMLFEQMQSD